MFKRCRRIAGWLLAGILLLSGCAGCGYMGGLGGVLPEDFRQGEICVQVKGEMCRTVSDGYTPPKLTPMEGMGVGMTDEPLDFSAEIRAGAPVDECGLRSFCITYTQPKGLAGVSVTCRVARGEDGSWTEAYTLSTGEGLSFAVNWAEIAGLTRPLSALLPTGDVTDARKEGMLTYVTLTDAAGCRSQLTFDTTAGRYPASVAWQDEKSHLHMRVTEIPD